jgi:pimeloyl-ACP methyl ester carboxylesterase
MFMDPEVMNGALRLRNRNPCGDLTSSASGAASNANSGQLGEINVPVLLIYEDQDIIYTQDGARQQQALFTGTDDLTWRMLENAGHFPMLEQRQDEYEALVSTWLHDRWGAS